MANGEGKKDIPTPSWITEQKNTLGQRSFEHAIKDSYAHGAGVIGRVEVPTPSVRTQESAAPITQAARAGTLPPSVQSGAGTTEKLQGAQKKFDPAEVKYQKEILDNSRS